MAVAGEQCVGNVADYPVQRGDGSDIDAGRSHALVDADALAVADAALIAPVHHASGGAEKMDTRELARTLRSRGREAEAPETLEQVFPALEKFADAASADAPALVVFFSNGAFGGLIRRFADFHRPLA